jgi:lipopolysaccharide export system permease protein
VLLGVVAGLGRLYHDSEITAAQAGGMGQGVLYAAALAVVLPAATLSAWLAFADGPAAAREVVEMRMTALRTAATRGLAPGQFRALGSGTTLYFQRLAADGALESVFLQRDVPASGHRSAHLQVVLAERARYAVSADSSQYLVELEDGRTYEGVPGTGSWRFTSFRRQLLRLPAPAATLPGKPRVDVIDTARLWSSSDARQRAELHWRIAWVLAVLVLGALAVPMARLTPRQGRHARIPWAVLLFGIYAGLLSAGRTMLERGDVPQVLALWWVHALAIALCVAMMKLPALVGRLWWRPAAR